MSDTKGLAERYPIGAEVRKTLTGRHGWVVGTEYSPREDVRVVHVDYRDGSTPAAEFEEFVALATGPRGPIREQSPGLWPFIGSTRTWTRTLAGRPYRFAAVTMPNGERRYFVRGYIGHDDGTAEGRERAMRFDSAWGPERSWIIRPQQTD